MNVSPDWLTGRAEDAPTFFGSGRPDGSALRMRMAWRRLKARAAQGDELWEFANPASTWRKLGRRTGYALVRDGAIVECVEVPK
jgi:hypothetical protein